MAKGIKIEEGYQSARLIIGRLYQISYVGSILTQTALKKLNQGAEGKRADCKKDSAQCSYFKQEKDSHTRLDANWQPTW